MKYITLFFTQWYQMRFMFTFYQKRKTDSPVNENLRRLSKKKAILDYETIPNLNAIAF